jgi:hypothetical protein
MATVEAFGKIRRFEDLIAWQKARELTLKVYRISRQDEFGKDSVCQARFREPRFRSCPTLRRDLKGVGWVSFISFFRPQRLLVPSYDRNFTWHST